jgi:hypothetical protein
MDIIGLISFSVFLILLLVLSYATIAFGVKSKRLTAENAQLKIDKIVLIDKLQEFINAKESQSIEQTDGFVRFLSESRDWAFKYIEGVQQAIDAVKVSVSFGKVSEESLEKLFSFLPEQQGENNEQGND